jgi:peptidoglycan/LPS O-acetylase OafA/YrhL
MASAGATRTRFDSLDGLRGAAALIVVAYHIALTDPRVANIYLGDSSDPRGLLEWAIYSSPLQLLWAGREAVLVFFVLSGFVLALPAARGRREVWISYYPRRILRIYLPAIGSLAFAWVSTLVVARSVVPGASDWLNEHATDPHGLLQVALGATLMGGSGGLNTPLWSLRWEVLFSALLPLYLTLARWCRHFLLIAMCAVIALIFAGTLTGALDNAFTYLPVFAVGVLMAFHIEGLARVASRLNFVSWTAIGVTAILALTSATTLAPFVESPRTLRALSTALISIGAALAVFLAAWCRPVSRSLTKRSLRWLGRVSFSLYLVHEPVLVAIAFALGGRAPLWLMYLIAVPVCLVVAEFFYRVVEGPAHRLSQWVGRRIRYARQPRDGTAAQPG